MELVIHKQLCPVTVIARMLLPQGAEVKHVALQNGVPNIWYTCDPTEPMESRIFRWAGTGHRIPANCEYVGTVFDGPYVWHLFEEKQP